ncbi:MAG TPA: ASKHA domain-containing protein [Actinomycetota bacterium]|nr:ASKHA domain-containing protein [Actinomycetota bacterium]
MPKRQVTYLPSGTVAHVPDGTTLFNAAHWAGIPIESTCGGRGTCGKCRVQVVDGRREPTPADHRKLPAAEVHGGWRLSCQAIVDADTTCEVPALQTSPKAATMGVGRFVLLEPNVQRVLVTVEAASLEDARSHVRRLLDALVVEGHEPILEVSVLPGLARALRDEAAELTVTLVGEHLVDVEAGDVASAIFGVSLDVGTTTVVANLVDLSTGAVAAVESTINRQAPFGADVIARMGHAMTGDEAVEDLRTAVVSTVNGLIESVCATAGVDRGRVVEAVVVGNATMLHLLLGIDPRSIALSPFVATILEPQDARGRDLGIEMHAEGRVSLLPSIGAYVGADLVGDIVATGLVREERVRLLVDVGTNGEIVCGSSERTVATAAPAGPAFEGGQIVHGMRATEGAIEGVVLDEAGVHLQVIGGSVEPRGICGSGLIDAVAQLRLVGLLEERGILVSRDDATLAGHPLADRIVDREGVRAFALTDDVLLTQLDIRELQSAKGAIATGIEVAMAALGVGPDDLDEVMLAGSFGTYIHPESARVLGLVPPVPVGRIRAVGNAASEGAKMCLMSFREREVAAEIPSFVEYLELSGAEDFNDRFIRNLAFPPLAGLGVEDRTAS